MRCTTFGILAGILLFTGALAACGGGGSGGGGLADGGASSATGWWAMEERDQGTGEPFEPAAIYALEDDGLATWLMGARLTRTDDRIRGAVPDASDPDRFEVHLTFADADTLEGEFAYYDDGVVDRTYDVRLERTTAPAGRLVLSGTFDARILDLDCPTAYASDLTRCWLLEGYVISDWNARDPTTLFVQFPDLQSPGIHDVSEPTVDVRILRGAGRTLGIGASGTLEITQVTADTLVGTFDVTLEDGAGVTGSFDTEILLISCD